MKIYICGKVTDNPKAYEEFEKAENMLRKNYGNKVEVINPVKLIIELQNETLSIFDNKRIMRECIDELLKSDKIEILPNYKQSDGAKIEIRLAKYCKIKIAYIREDF